MGWLNGKDEFGNMEINSTHQAGLPNIKENTPTKIIVNEESRTITFKKRFFNKDQKVNDVVLSFDKIRGAGYITQDELVEKSTIGRAVVGGVLFGGIGALVGGMSGQGKKTKKINYFAIAYTDSFGNDKTLLFDDIISQPKALPKRLNEIAAESKPSVVEDKRPIEL